MEVEFQHRLELLLCWPSTFRTRRGLRASSIPTQSLNPRHPNSFCGVPLTVPRLSCAATIPVWDKICGECGASQDELIPARRAELDSQRQEAESRRREYQYDEALAIAGQYAEETDQRFRDMGEWASDFVRMVTEEQSAQHESAAARYREALDCAQSFNYAGGVEALQSIPPALHTDKTKALLDELQSLDEEWRTLDREIRDRLKQGESAELLCPVNRLLQLRPDREDVVALQARLQGQVEAKPQGAPEPDNALRHALAAHR